MSGGASYSILVLPGKHPMQPDSHSMSLAVAKKLLQLVKDGATIIMNKDYLQGAGLKDKEDSIRILIRDLLMEGNKKGRIIPAPYTNPSFAKLGIKKDVEITNNDHSIAWTHRKSQEGDIYFISNQKDTLRDVQLSFRITGKLPEVFDPVSGTIGGVGWKIKNGKTIVDIRLEANQSVFIVFNKQMSKPGSFRRGIAWISEQPFREKWTVAFDKNYGGPGSPVVFDTLTLWNHHTDPTIKYYSGTAVYQNSFDWDAKAGYKEARIRFDSIYNIATIKVNGVHCGTLWTPPYKIDITKALKDGINKVEIEVGNTWANRLIGDQFIAGRRLTWTTAPFRLKDKPLLPAGIRGIRLNFETD
jgi:hypothetical protein